jgi:hypothetical protein
MAVQFHPAAAYVAVGIFTIPLDLTADVDLTSTSGQTNGFSARALLVGSTAGNIKFKDLLGATRTQAVAANQRLDSGVSYVFSTGNGTTAATVTALG